MKISYSNNFVKIENDLIILTDFGKAFVELLKEKGFVCDMLNDQIFTFTEEPGIQMRLSKMRKK